MNFKVIFRSNLIPSVLSSRLACSPCNSSAAFYMCCAHMDTSKQAPSSAIVKKSVPFLPFSGVPLTLDTSMAQPQCDSSEDRPPSDVHVAAVMDTEAAGRALKSILGIGSPARATETMPRKDLIYGHPKFHGFIHPSVPDVVSEDPAVMDYSCEQEGSFSLGEGPGDFSQSLEAVEARLPAVEKSTIVFEEQGMEQSSLGTETEHSVQSSKDIATAKDPGGDSPALETSTPAPKMVKKSRARKQRRKKQNQTAATLPSLSPLQASDTKSTDLEREGSPGCCEETSFKEEGSEESCLLAHLPSAVDSSSESESEDGVYSLKLLFTGPYKSAMKKGKARKRQYSSSSDKWQRPNYFVAIQTRTAEIHKNIEKVVDHIRSCEPAISKACVAIPTLHLTVLVLRVNDDDGSLERAKEALVRSYDLLKDDLNSNPLVLQFKGLGHFRNEVLFAKVEGQEAKERLKKIADVCLQEFKNSSLDLSCHKEFKPHLTIVKLSKTNKRACKIRKIQSEWYETFAEDHFGSQPVFSLQLLSMNKPKDENGYYYCSQECMFENVPVENAGAVLASPTGSSAGSSPQSKRKLLELECAKDNIRRTISTLTKAKLDEISAAIAGGEVTETHEDLDKEERTSHRVTTGATEATFPAETEAEVTCATLPTE